MWKNRPRGGVFNCRIDKNFAYDHIAIVVGNTRAVPRIETISSSTFKNNRIRKYISNSVANNNDASITIYSTASKSKKRIDTYSILNKIESEEAEEINSIDKTVKLAKSVADAVDAGINTPPTNNGTQYLETIMRVSDEMFAMREENEKCLVLVIGSGLSDGGFLDFSSNDLLGTATDPETVYEKIAESEMLPAGKYNNEKNYRVEWVNLGEVVSPQNELNEKEKENLQEIYDKVLRHVYGKNLKSNLILTTRVPKIEASVPTDKTIKVAKVEGVCIDFTDSIYDENSPISFIGSQVEFKNLQLAREELDRIAKKINCSKAQKIIVEGYVALAKRQSPDYKLAQDRAERIKNELINLGVDASIITAKGMGKGPYEEEDANGVWREELASRNRIVKIIKG